MEVTNNTYEALNRYFTTLSHTGYKSYNEVYKLIVLSFIEELLCDTMLEFLTEDDYKLIINSIDCLYGNCTIPYPSNKKGIDNKTFGLPCNCLLKNNF